MKILIVGSGRLANALLAAKLSFQTGEIAKWGTTCPTLNEKAIVVHAGSGRQLKECLDFCSRTKSLLLELSTGLETENWSPDFPLVICPNTSILLLKALSMLKANGRSFEKYEISITESHQSTKKTEPATAYAFANSLKFPLDRIVSVRDPEIQHNEIGIPPEFLDRHAYHKIVIRDKSEEITIETKVLGHDSYANGVRTIIEALLNYNLEDKKYSIMDLIKNSIL